MYIRYLKYHISLESLIFKIGYEKGNQKRIQNICSTRNNKIMSVSCHTVPLSINIHTINPI